MSLSINKFLLDMEKYFKDKAKTSAINCSYERKLAASAADIRRSLESAAGTGKERSDSPAWP